MGAHLCWKCDCVFSFLLLTSWFKTQFQVWEERGTYPKVPLSMQEQIKLAHFRYSLYTAETKCGVGTREVWGCMFPERVCTATTKRCRLVNL